jgi:hypothetical protein
MTAGSKDLDEFEPEALPLHIVNAAPCNRVIYVLRNVFGPRVAIVEVVSLIQAAMVVSDLFPIFYWNLWTVVEQDLGFAPDDGALQGHHIAPMEEVVIRHHDGPDLNLFGPHVEMMVNE